MISGFVEEEGDALKNSHSRAQILKKDGNGNGSWDHDTTEAEREGREDEEVL